MFNPKVSDFLKQNPDKTVIGLFWGGYWRLIVAFYGIVLVLWGLLAVIGLLI